MLQLIEAKQAGEVVETEEPEPETASVTDLMEVLRQSVEAARSRRKPGNAHQATRLTTRAADQKPSNPTGRSKTRNNKSKAGSGTAGIGDDLVSKSKQELYAMAQELGVPGRSSMTRDQLAEAITGTETQRKAS